MGCKTHWLIFCLVLKLLKRKNEGYKVILIKVLAAKLYTLYNAILRIARNFLETKENVKISAHPFSHINLGWFSLEWSKNFFFFSKKKIKMADSKKAHFSKLTILKIFSQKFLRFILGLVGLNDAKGIYVAQRIWPWGCPTKAQKQPKNAFSVLFRCFWAFVWQPHGHICWAT